MSAAEVVTLSTGGTVRLELQLGEVVVIVDHPDAPDGMRYREAGRVTEGAFQPASFFPAALRPETLRAIADLIESMTKESR